MEIVRVPSVTVTPSLSRRASSVSLREEAPSASQMSRNRHGSTHSLRSFEDTESATPLLAVASMSDWRPSSPASQSTRHRCESPSGSGNNFEYSEKAFSERLSSSSNMDVYFQTNPVLQSASPTQHCLEENARHHPSQAGGCSCLPLHMLSTSRRVDKTRQTYSMSLRIAASVVASFLLYLLIVALRGDHQLSLSGLLSKATFIDGTSSLYRSSPAFGGEAQHADIFPGLHNLCDICNCSSPGSPSLPASSFKLRKDVRRSDLPDLVRHAILDIQCRHVYSTRNKAFVTLRDMIRDPSTVMAWDLSSIDLGKPTSYMFTKTAPVSKVASLRAQYLDRHVKTMHLFNEKMRNGTSVGGWAGHYEDGSDAASKQTLWILAEDNNVIDKNVAAMLAEGNISYIYFALGPTRNFGNAQHNAALSMIYHLSNPHTGALGHGPIFSADDDAEIHPDLLMYVWRLKRIGLWPMGNLGPTGFEGPVWDSNNQISGWSAGNSWRKYPVDNGAFAFNSTLLGNELPGPAFWPTDTDGGETEFIERVVQSKEELEPICKDCHVAWHNHPLNIPHVGTNVYRPG